MEYKHTHTHKPSCHTVIRPGMLNDYIAETFYKESRDDSTSTKYVSTKYT